MLLLREKICVPDDELRSLRDCVDEIDSDLSSEVVSEVVKSGLDMRELLTQLSSWGPYVTLLAKHRGDWVSMMSATALFLQTKGAQVTVTQVKTYFQYIFDSVVGEYHQNTLVEMFTVAVQLLSEGVFGAEASIMQQTPLWGAAMKVAHWLILGPIHILVGTGGGVMCAAEFYSSVFPEGMSPVGVVKSFVLLLRAVWNYGLPVLTGQMTLSEAMSSNLGYSWLVECQEAIVHSSDYEWLEQKGYLSVTTKALTVEFEQYISSLRTRGKLFAASYSSSSPQLFAKCVDMDKQLAMLAARVRALRTGVENKVQPVCIVLLSVPGCQKSTFQMLLLKMVWEALYPGEPYDNSMVAPVNPAAARLDNVNGQTRIIVIDDAAQYNLEYVQNPIVVNPMNFVNTVPTMLDQAEISRKGTEMMNHKAVLINSNSRSMQILKINTCPAAAFRRIWRTLVIAPKAGEAVGAHNAGRLLTVQELNSMYWFSVERYECSGQTVKVINEFSGREVVTMSRDAASEQVTIQGDEAKSFSECVAHLKARLTEYLNVQNSVVTQKEEILSLSLCSTCGNVTPLCMCPNPNVALVRVQAGHTGSYTEAEMEDAFSVMMAKIKTEFLPFVSQGGIPTAPSIWAAPFVFIVFVICVFIQILVNWVMYGVQSTKYLFQRVDAAVETVSEAADSAKALVAAAHGDYAALRAKIRAAVFARLPPGVRYTIAALFLGSIAFGVKRMYDRATREQGLEAYRALGAVPPLKVDAWPKGVHTPYVVPPPAVNGAMRSEIPRNKTNSVLVKARENLVRLHLMLDKDRSKTMYGLAIGPGRVITCKHLFSGQTGVVTLEIEDRKKGGLSNSRLVMIEVEKDVFPIGERDYVLVAVGTSYYPEIPTSVFPDKVSRDFQVAGEAYRFDPDTKGDVLGVSHLTYRERANAQGVVSPGYEYTALQPYGDGTCGTLVYTSMLGAPYIVGLHSIGTNHTSYGWAEGLVREEVDLAMKQMLDSDCFQCGLHWHGKLNGRERPDCEDPPSRTIFQHVEGFGSYLGFYPKLYTSDRSSTFERTPLHGKVVAETGMKLDVPKLKAHVNEAGEFVDPLLRAARLNSAPQGMLDPVLLEKCFDDLLDDIESIPGFDWNQAGFMSLSQAINGEPGAVNSMNMSSAAGAWIGRKKKDHLSGPIGAKELDTVMQEELNAIFECWDRNEMAGLVYSMKVKDEPRKQGKQPRVFSAGSFAETIIARMLFGGIFEYIKKFIGKTEFAVGINCCDEKSWARELKRFGGLDAVVRALDATDFDLANIIAPYVYHFVGKRFRSRTKFHRWWHYQKCFAREQFFCFRNYRGEVVGQRGNQSSGRSLTSEVNSFCTSVYERIYYYSARRIAFDYDSWDDVFTPEFKFNLWILLICYGDDFVMRLLQSMPWYTMEVRNEIAKVIGMTYSMPDKESALRELTMREVDFLKRGFAIQSDLVVAPLEMTSILKSMAFYHPGALTRRQLMAEGAKNAHAQLYMHGRDVFEQKSSLIRSWLEELRDNPHYGNVVDDVFPLEQHKLTYDLLLDQHRAGTYNELSSGV